MASVVRATPRILLRMVEVKFSRAVHMTSVPLGGPRDVRFCPNETLSINYRGLGLI